jgi:hypothetical protein
VSKAGIVLGAAAILRRSGVDRGVVVIAVADDARRSAGARRVAVMIGVGADGRLVLVEAGDGVQLILVGEELALG